PSNPPKITRTKLSANGILVVKRQPPEDWPGPGRGGPFKPFFGLSGAVSPQTLSQHLSTYRPRLTFLAFWSIL
ncbi:MAG: hypothetical protein ABSA29_17410, partial [Terriglobales bacterium]